MVTKILGKNTVSRSERDVRRKQTVSAAVYWRTLKANGELNLKYPGGIEAQKEILEKEGYIVIRKGRTNIKYYVKDYEKALFTL